ncbi:MAG: AI-2E family transporter [bacterium]|nr:AI-2E family transporter [bacterium]
MLEYPALKGRIDLSMQPENPNSDRKPGNPNQSDGGSSRPNPRRSPYNRNRGSGNSPDRGRERPKGLHDDRNRNNFNRSSRQRHSRDRNRPDYDRDRPVKRVMADTQSKSILNITNLVTLSVLVGLILFVIRIASVFGIFLFSFVIAFLLFPVVEWLTERRVPRVWAILITFALVGAILIGIVAAIIPSIVTQGNAIITQLPEWANKWQEGLTPRIAAIQAQLRHYGITTEDITGYINSIVPNVQRWLIDVSNRIAIGVSGAVGSIVTLFTVPIIVFYLLLDAQRIYASLINLAPKHTATDIQNLLNSLEKMLNHYLRGQLKLSFLMFVIITATLLLLGVKNALLLGFLAGITEVIPIVGAIITVIPAILITYFIPSDYMIFSYVHIAWARALILLAIYLAIQWCEGHIMVPRIMGKDLNLHPLTVVFSLLAGGYLAGIFGMLLSLPIAASLKVVFETYYPAFIQQVENLMSRRPYSADNIED